MVPFAAISWMEGNSSLQIIGRSWCALLTLIAVGTLGGTWLTPTCRRGCFAENTGLVKGWILHPLFAGLGLTITANLRWVIGRRGDVRSSSLAGGQAPFNRSTRASESVSLAVFFFGLSLLAPPGPGGRGRRRFLRGPRGSRGRGSLLRALLRVVVFVVDDARPVGADVRRVLLEDAILCRRCV